MNEKATFDHEKLDVYQIELLFIAWVAALLTELRSAAPGFLARFAISLIAPVSHPCSTPLRATESVRENKERSSSTTRAAPRWNAQPASMRSPPKHW